jgi:hypothetical protein
VGVLTGDEATKARAGDTAYQDTATESLQRANDEHAVLAQDEPETLDEACSWSAPLQGIGHTIFKVILVSCFSAQR